jgi:hypothetical protein
LDVLFHLVEVVNTIIADSNRANFALIVRFNQSLPSTLTSVSTSIGSMKEHKVDVSKPGLLQSLLHLSKGILVAQCASRNLAGEEYIFTFEFRAEDSLAAWSLVAIGGCRIDL